MCSVPHLLSCALVTRLLQIRFVKNIPSKLAHTKPEGAPEGWEVRLFGLLMYRRLILATDINGLQPPVLPIQFQTCSYRVIIPLTQSLLPYLLEAVPDDDHTVTKFDVWIHTSLLTFAGPSTFNVL